MEGVIRSRETEVRLPEAPPGVYLRWMAFWRDLERRMDEHPAFARLAAQEWSWNRGSRFVSADLIPEVVRQATEAQRGGQATVVPHLRAELGTLQDAAAWVIRRIRLLDHPDVLRAMGVTSPERDVVRLQVVAAAEVALHLERESALQSRRAS